MSRSVCVHCMYAKQTTSIYVHVQYLLALRAVKAIQEAKKRRMEWTLTRKFDPTNIVHIVCVCMFAFFFCESSISDLSTTETSVPLDACDNV